MFSMFKGVLVNSFFALVPGAFKDLEEGEWCQPEIYSVGPLIRSNSENRANDEFERLKWLDKHPAGSVLFVSFGSDGHLDPFEFLPNGFLDHIKDRGLVVSSWAPQVEILSHGSTGVWNSILECGEWSAYEAMIAWPLFAEQKMNAVFLTDGLGVACRVKVDEDGMVGRNEIKCVRSLINGEDGQYEEENECELKDLGTTAMSQDGSSTRSLVSVAQQWV
ncbi:hydroquinone glucosyltransferase-like protein [Tanacetum coccineum]